MASVDLIAVVVVTSVAGVSSTVEEGAVVFLVEVVGIVGVAALVAGEEVGVAVGSVDFVAAAVSAAVVFAGGGKGSEPRTGISDQ